MNLKSYLKKAQKEKWAIGQFNISTIEQMRAVMDAAKETKSPVILGTSEGESAFFGMEEAVALLKIFRKKYNVSAYLNLDHGKSIDLIKRAIDCGYDAVHFDGSELSLNDNIKTTKKIVSYAHKKGVVVEGEVGIIKGGSEVHLEKIMIEQKDLALPDDVFKFIKETKADSVAVAIGSAHGLYEGGKIIDFERLEDINKKTNAFLVLHGGSGIKDEDIKKSIRLGVVKININTELRVLWKQSLEKLLENSEVKPYKILPEVQRSIKNKVLEKIKIFGSYE